MNAPTHGTSTVFKQGISNKNPSGVSLANVVKMSVENIGMSYSMPYKDITAVSIV